MASVYDLLWEKNLDVAKQTLEVPFLQHMQLGNLQADFYVSFTIQDINYLVKLTEMLAEMCERVKDPEDIRAFMVSRYKSYKKYADNTLQAFYLSGVSDINPSPAMKKYLSNYRAIMETEEPIFFAVALLPCERLWLWVAHQLKETCCNAYFTWKKDNMYGHPGDHYKALLDKYLTTPDMIAKANTIFRQQLQNERDFFASLLRK